MAAVSPAQQPLGPPHGLPQYRPPDALKWCEAKDLYFVRTVTEMLPERKHAKRAIAITENRVYVCEPKGTLIRAVRISDIASALLQQTEVKKSGLMGGKSTESGILLKIPTEKDVLIVQTPDKENGPEGNDTARLLDCLKAVYRSRTGRELQVSELAQDAEEKLADSCQFQAAEGYVDTRTLIEAKRRQKEEEERMRDEHTALLEERVQTLTKQLDDEKGRRVADAVVKLERRLQEVEEQLGAKSKHDRDADGAAAALQRRVEQLQTQLEEERACREDMVRDMRSEFDTEFIKKQADEFELRQRAHQRLRDRDAGRIQELEERLEEPKSYSGPADLQQRIRGLETRLAAQDVQLHEHHSRAIHFESVADEQYAAMRKYWEFINNGLLCRIRDLTAGKDPKSLPLLPQMPPAPQPPLAFTFDPAAPRPPKYRDAAPAPSGDVVLDDDLELDGGGADIDLDDDL